MQFKIIHHGRKWRRVDNHMDQRHCPECACTVNGNWGQNAHLQWHIDLIETLQSVTEHAAETMKPSPPWTAAVDEDDGQDAISEGA